MVGGTGILVIVVVAAAVVVVAFGEVRALSRVVEPELVGVVGGTGILVIVLVIVVVEALVVRSPCC